MRKVMIVLTAVVSVSLVGFLIVSFISPPANSTHLNASELETSASGTPDSPDDTYTPPALNGEGENGEYVNEDNISASFIPATEIDTDPSSITVFINREYALPEDYEPDDLVVPNVLFNLDYYDERKLMRSEAAAALEELFAAAEKDGYTLYGVSAYRSYSRQRKIFLNNIVKRGKEHTLKYSAVPGTSEHQSGLSIDVSTKSFGFRLLDDFINTPEGVWLSKNAYRFGYIIRYPVDKVEITGYAYEPWHIRYVGKDLAAYLYTNDLTLDEYYQYTPSKDFDFEAKYAALINYRPPVVVTPPPKDDPALLDEEALLDGEPVEDKDLEKDPEKPKNEKPAKDKEDVPEEEDNVPKDDKENPKGDKKNSKDDKKNPKDDKKDPKEDPKKPEDSQEKPTETPEDPKENPEKEDSDNVEEDPSENEKEKKDPDSAESQSENPQEKLEEKPGENSENPEDNKSTNK